MIIKAIRKDNKETQYYLSIDELRKCDNSVSFYVLKEKINTIIVLEFNRFNAIYLMNNEGKTIETLFKEGR